MYHAPKNTIPQQLWAQGTHSAPHAGDDVLMAAVMEVSSSSQLMGKMYFRSCFAGMQSWAATTGHTKELELRFVALSPAATATAARRRA